jgi:hypothetical protein
MVRDLGILKAPFDIIATSPGYKGLCMDMYSSPRRWWQLKRP